MRMSFFVRSIVVSVLVLLAADRATRAADLHFVVFAETLDPLIGTLQDLNAGQNWARTIEAYTGLNLRLQTLSGSDLTTANARRMLQSIHPGEDDVVYFMFTGHGANAGGSQWPTFTFLMVADGDYLSFDEVVATLQPKPQRLLVILADCCNVSMSSSGRVTPGFEDAAQSGLTAANFQNLFLNFRGTVKVSSSKLGQYSLGDSAEGGLFTSTFMDTFFDLASSVDGISWQAILSQTSTDATQMAESYIATGELGDIEAQVAQYAVATEQVGADEPDQPDPVDDGSNVNDDTQDTTDPTTDDQDSAGAPACGPMGLAPLAMMFAAYAVRHRRHESRAQGLT